MTALRPRAAGRAFALVVVLLVVPGVSGCARGEAAAGGSSVGAPQSVATLRAGPLLTTDDLDELLPGLSDDADLRPRWETRDELGELQLLRGECGADLVSSAASAASASGAVEHDAEQWWQGTSPQYATLDVLRWRGDGSGDPEAWRDGVVTAESHCPEAVLLGEHLGVDGGPEVTVVVRRWEQATTGGTPGMTILPLWQVGGFAVDGSTAIAVRVGAYSARTAPEAWELARQGLTAAVARAAERAAAPPPSSS